MSFLDTLLGDAINVSPCIREADAKTAPMFERRQKIRNEWNPTGTYTPDQLEKVVNAAFNMMRNAGTQVLDTALASAQLGDARDELNAARDAIFDEEGKQFKYRDAIRDARANGITQIVATDLKRWVLSAMEVTQAAVFVAAKVSCERPWWFSVLVAAMQFFISAADIIVSIAGIVLDTAKKALKVFDWLAKENLLIAALVVGGAYFLYRRLT